MQLGLEVVAALGPDRAPASPTAADRRRPPNRLPKRPPRSPRSPRSSTRTLPRSRRSRPGPPPPPNPPGPPGPTPDATISRTSSYSLRFSASPSTSLRGGDLLEALLGVRVARVGVGVELLRELPVGARDLLLGRVRRHAEHGVVVLLEPLPLRSHRALPFARHAHHRGPQHAALEPVPGAHRLARRAARRRRRPACTASCSFGSNGAPSASMRSRPAFSSTATSCARMLVHAVAHLLRLGRVDAGDAAERAVERVEHREQLLDEPLGGALDERGLLAQHALAVVLEVGLHPPQRVDELVALACSCSSCDEVGLDGGLRLGDIRRRSSPTLVVDTPSSGAARRSVTRVCSPGSSTISASATSSSSARGGARARRHRRRRRPRSAACCALA